jgi:hypothetical protein
MKLLFALSIYFLNALAAPGDPPPNRAEGWNSVTNNDTMFDAGVPNTDSVRQSDAYILNSNANGSCIETTFVGRSDGDCATNPTHPECVGFNKTVQNATTCVEYFVPASLGCKVYGAGGYSMEEWLSFGEQYHQGMSGCFGFKNQNDTDLNNISSLADMLTGSTEDPGQNGNISSSSSISKSTLRDKDDEGKTKDGSLYLGYEDGEILRRTKAGESFLDILTDAPFTQKLNPEQKKSAKNAITNANEIAEKALEKRGLIANKNEQKSGGEGSGGGTSIASNKSGNTQTGNNAGGGTSGGSGTPPPPQLPLPAAGNKTISSTETKRTLASSEANKAVEQLARSSAKSLGEDASLFERVAQYYRRKTPSMKSLEASETGSALKAMETPALFRSL